MEGQTHLADLIPRERVSPPPEGAVDLTIPLQGGSLPARVFLASPEAPKLFFFPAEREKIDHYDQLGRYFLEQDINFVVIGYRGANEGRGEASFETLFPDAKEAFFFLEDWFREKGYRGRVALHGRSLGAGVALALASELKEEINALILDSPIIDGKDWLARRGLATEEDPFRVLEHVKSWRKPLLMFQAQLDEEVSLTEVEKLLIFCPGHNKRLLIMPGYRREETIERGGALYAETIAELLNRLASRFGKRKRTLH